MTSDMFAGYPALQRIAAFAREEGLALELIPGSKGKDFLVKTVLLEGLPCLISSLRTFFYTVPNNPTSRKFTKSFIRPYQENDPEAPKIIVIDVCIDQDDFVLQELLFVPRKVYFRAYPTGNVRIPLEDAKRPERGARLQWEAHTGRAGWDLCITLQERGAI